MTDWYAEAAAELRRMADDLDALAGAGLPRPHFGIDVLPGGATDGEVIAAVDAVAGVLLGTAAETVPLSGGVFHHTAHGSRGPIDVGVFNRVPDPTAREQAELEQLRAELAAACGDTAVPPSGAGPIVMVPDEVAEILCTASAGEGVRR